MIIILKVVRTEITILRIFFFFLPTNDFLYVNAFDNWIWKMLERTRIYEIEWVLKSNTDKKYQFFNHLVVVEVKEKTKFSQQHQSADIRRGTKLVYKFNKNSFSDDPTEGREKLNNEKRSNEPRYSPFFVEFASPFELLTFFSNLQHDLKNLPTSLQRHAKL